MKPASFLSRFFQLLPLDIIAAYPIEFTVFEPQGFNRSRPNSQGSGVDASPGFRLFLLPSPPLEISVSSSG